MVDWIKEMWTGSTRSERLLVGLITFFGLADFLSGAIFWALLQLFTALVALWLLNKEVKGPFNMEVIEETFDRTGGILNEFIDE